MKKTSGFFFLVSLEGHFFDQEAPRCVRAALAGALLARSRGGGGLLGRIKEGHETRSWLQPFGSGPLCLKICVWKVEADLEARI